jgi:hypothetical protein
MSWKEKKRTPKRQIKAMEENLNFAMYAFTWKKKLGLNPFSEATRLANKSEFVGISMVRAIIKK